MARSLRAVRYTGPNTWQRIKCPTRNRFRVQNGQLGLKPAAPAKSRCAFSRAGKALVYAALKEARSGHLHGYFPRMFNKPAAAFISGFATVAAHGI